MTQKANNVFFIAVLAAALALMALVLIDSLGDTGAAMVGGAGDAGGDSPAPATRLSRPLTRGEAVRCGLSLREAKYYTKISSTKVRCGLCPFRCTLGPGERGACKTRVNFGGKLRTLVYGLPVARGVDPIEKKPLHHFLPGSSAYSIATAGCNLSCLFCQNHTISQAYPEGGESRHRYGVIGKKTPAQLVALAKAHNCAVIAYTYTEPAVFYEYMLDTAKLARKAGLKNVMITCGYINTEPLKELLPYLDGANVDLKGFTEKFYAEYCGATLKPVLETLKTLHKAGIELEVTNLVIPGANDNPATIRAMCEWIKTELDADVPLHFSRYSPRYKMKKPAATPLATLQRAKKIAEEVGLKFVYIGNVSDETGGNTYCPKCGRLLVKRGSGYRYSVSAMNIRDGKCKYCGETIRGVWK